MKLVTYWHKNETVLGIWEHGGVYPLWTLDPRLPRDMSVFLIGGSESMFIAQQAHERLLLGEMGFPPLYDAQLAAPVPRPASVRDAYAFRQHVETSRRNRGLDMIPEFDEFPVFYFSNHQAVFGPGDVPCMPHHFNRLDFELEVAVVINRHGKNISAAHADDYIAGYMIMNDFSARAMQMQEMKLNLGPAKGKDFATALGPWLVTPDEMNAYLTESPSGHIGRTYRLEMTCEVNGIQVSKGNLADMNWTFAEIIERVSYGVDIYPGDVIGSGTVGTGCFLELNGTGKRAHPDYVEQWLRPGDEVAMEVSALGKLANKVIQVSF